jgi:hypothetical protein
MGSVLPRLLIEVLISGLVLLVEWLALRRRTVC